MIRFFEYFYQYEISRNIVHQNVMDPNEFFNMEREFIKNKTQDWNITGWNCTYHVTNSFSFSHFLSCTFLTQIKKS